MNMQEELAQNPFKTVSLEELPHRVRCIENTWIPMADGARLAARIWLPESAASHPVPALIEYIPYRKRDLTRPRDDVNHPYLAAHGYACLRIDLRGSGDSDGVLEDQYLDQEQTDGVACIEWAAQQPWCDGQVGMFGISWGGFNALQIAARQPEPLKAIIAACATDDLYADNMHYMGGCLLADNLSEATTMFGYNSCPPDPAIVGERWREMWMKRLAESGLWLDIWLNHQRRSEFWQRGSVCEDYSAIRCPVMAVSGWADGYTNAVSRLLENLRVPRMGLIGPWGHKYPHMGMPGPAIGFLQEMLRWFDHWLKDTRHDLEREPMLRVWMQDSVAPTTWTAYRPGRWIGEHHWPSERIQFEQLSMAPRTLVLPGQPVPEQDPDYSEYIQSPLSVGLFAGKWCSYAAAPDLPHDQREEDGGALVFESAPLPERIEIFGVPVVELELSANRPIAQVCVRLEDALPDGRATRVTYGLLNLTHRDSDEDPEPLVPGQRYKVRVPLNCIAQVFPAGNRVRLAISSSYWPLAWPAPEPVGLNIYPAGCWLRLPCRPPDPHDEEMRAFMPPEGTPQTASTPLRVGDHNWYVHRNLADDTSVLEVIKDNGRWTIDDIDLTVRSETREWYRSRADAFDSIRGETMTLREFQRGNWHVTVRTRTVARSSPTHFYLQAELDAWEGDKRVFSENWDREIPRDHV